MRYILSPTFLLCCLVVFSCPNVAPCCVVTATARGLSGLLSWTVRAAPNFHEEAKLSENLFEAAVVKNNSLFFSCSHVLLEEKRKIILKKIYYIFFWDLYFLYFIFIL